jgi:hypothetical protein
METEEYKITTDQEEIRNWVEERGGSPAFTNAEENEGRGVLAIKFKDNDPTLEPLSWQEFFDTFETSRLAFRYNSQEKNPDIFSYNFIRRDKNMAETENDEDNNELPEDSVPIENLYPSAPVHDIDSADSPGSDPDYPGTPEEQ